MLKIHNSFCRSLNKSEYRQKASNSITVIQQKFLSHYCIIELSIEKWVHAELNGQYEQAALIHTR